MPIDTTITLETEFQVQDAVDVAPPGSLFEAYVEHNTIQLPMGQQVVNITFNTEKAALGYFFDELRIYNEIDATPIVLGFIETSRSTTGFQLTLSANPDSGNYYLKWKARIPTTVVDGVVTATPSTGQVVEVSAHGTDGIVTSVSNPTTAPTVNIGIGDGTISESKLNFTPVTGDVLTPTNVETVSGKDIGGQVNTLHDIPVSAITGDGIIAQNLADPGADRTLRWNNGTKQFAFTDAGFLYTPTQKGVVKEIYISARTSGSGTGTKDDPYDGSTTVKFDAILTGLQGTTDLNFYFSPGVFTTKGNLNWHCNSRWSFFLTPNTTIKLDVLSAGEATSLSNFSTMFIGPSGSLVEDILIQGGIWDLNLANQTQPLTASAINLDVDGFTLRNTKFIGWGSTNGAESFTVFAGSNGTTRIYRRGQLAEGCEFTSPAAVTNTGFISLLNVGGGQVVSNATSVSNGWIVGVTVRQCYFHDITTTPATGLACVNGGNWCQDVHFHHNRFENIISASNAGYAYYRDTGSVINLMVDNDQIFNVTNAFDFISDASSVLDNIFISRENITTVGYFPIRVTHNTASHGTNLTISDCYIKASLNAGIDVQFNDSARLRNNTIAVTSNHITSTSTTFIERFNNRKADGTMVDAVLDATLPSFTDSGQLTLSGTINYTLTGNVNDLSPTGLANASCIRIASTGNNNITGLQGGVDGRVMVLVCTSVNFNLINQSGLSSASNRFLLPADTVLPLNTSIALRYDGTSGFWRPWSRALSNTGVTAQVYGDGTHVLTSLTVDSSGRLTAASQVASPSTTGTTTGFTAVSGTAVLAGSTFTGNTGTTAYTIGDIVNALKTLNMLAP